MVTPSLKELDKFRDYVNVCVSAYPVPEKGNTTRLLHEIWMWQEIKALADDALKTAWAAAQTDLIEDDAALRADLAGEETVADTAYYTAIVRCDAPRMSFDRDTFVGLVAAKFAIPAGKIAPLVDKAKKGTAAPLSKKVVRVAKSKKGG